MQNVCLGPTFVYDRMTGWDKGAYKSMGWHKPCNMAQLKKQLANTTQQVHLPPINSTPAQTITTIASHKPGVASHSLRLRIANQAFKYVIVVCGQG